MKNLIMVFGFLLIASKGIAAEVCVIDSDLTPVGPMASADCTTGQDSTKQWGTSVESKQVVAARIIKSLLEKGYEIKSNSLLTKP